MGLGFSATALRENIFGYLKFAETLSFLRKSIVIVSLIMTGQLLRICTLLCDDFVSEDGTLNYR